MCAYISKKSYIFVKTDITYFMKVNKITIKLASTTEYEKLPAFDSRFGYLSRVLT